MRVFLGAAMAASVLALTACGGGGGGDDIEAKVLHRGNSAEPLSLDPHQASGTWENNIIGDMFMGLFTENAAGEPVPGMAESYEISDDLKTWTFTLRDAVWSDGTPVTAYDFEFAMQRILNPDTAAQYAFMLYPIVNAQQIVEGTLPPEELGVRAIDDKTFEISLVSPTPFLPGLLTHYTSYPVPKHVVEQYGVDWIQPENIQVNGAFKLVQWRSNDFVQVEKNPNFYDAENVCLNEIFYYPTIDSNTAMRQVTNGELHINDEIPGNKIDDYRESLPGYVRVHPWISTIYIAFNTTVEPFDDPRVTNALAMAIDRDFLTEDVIQGGRVPAYGLVPPGINNYVEDTPETEWASLDRPARMEMARRLLEDAGFGPENPLKFEYQHRNTGDNPLAAPVIQSNWNEIAPWVSVTLQSVETQIHYDELRAGDFEVGDAGWVADYNDPQNYLYLLETRTGSMNYGKYSNPQYDELLMQSAFIMDTQERAEVLAEAEAMMLNDMPIAPMWYDSNRNMVNPAVTGWVDNVVDIHRSRYLCLEGGSE